jgi:hypothetical protein
MDRGEEAGCVQFWLVLSALSSLSLTSFRLVPNFDRVATQSIPESDIQEYQRNLERLDQVLVNIEKYIHFAFAALKKGEVVERLFKMVSRFNPCWYDNQR